MTAVRTMRAAAITCKSKREMMKMLLRMFVVTLVVLTWTSVLLAQTEGDVAKGTKPTRPTRPNVYLYYDAEDDADGALPPPAKAGEPVRFWYGWRVVGQATGPGVIDSPELAAHVRRGHAPQGKKYFEWEVTDKDHHSRLTEVKGRDFPIKCELGKTYYVACYFNFTRINGKDIWHETGDSGDKGIELRGPGRRGAGIRWILSRGHWGCFAPNKDHRYTVWLGDLVNHNPEIRKADGLNPPPNRSGYSAKSSTLQEPCKRLTFVQLGEFRQLQRGGPFW